MLLKVLKQQTFVFRDNRSKMSFNQFDSRNITECKKWPKVTVSWKSLTERVLEITALFLWIVIVATISPTFQSFSHFCLDAVSVQTLDMK